MFQVGDEGLDPIEPGRTRWTDLPADYHGKAASFSFGDGHAKTHRWSQPLPSLSTVHIPAQLNNKFPVSPNNPDIIWLFERATVMK